MGTRKEGAERLARIEAMERLYDAARCALHAAAEDPAGFSAAQDTIQTLDAHYTGGQWLADYEADEAGLLPPGLKRGVLAQDALFDLLEENKRQSRREDE